MVILVTGGAGYIGSHVVSQLVKSGQEVVIVDDLSTGSLSRVKDHKVHQLDLSKVSSTKVLQEVIQHQKISSIIHFAAKKSAPESVKHPEYYFQQNIGGLLNLIKATKDTDVTELVFLPLRLFMAMCLAR